MTDRIRGPDKRVEGSNRSRRIRANRLNEERADDKLHLAEFEEYVRNEHEQREQKEKEPPERRDEQRAAPQEPPTDIVELHERVSDEPTSAPPAENPPSRDEDHPPADEPPHLDITV